ncbi:LysR substrate-binding domain-containing protein [Streptomyces sp. NPDC054783]
MAEQLDERARRHIAALDGTPEGGRPGGPGTGALFAERFATALLVEFPPGEPVARIVHCGHPEPYVVHSGEVRPYEPDQPGAPLGLGTSRSSPRRRRPAPGATHWLAADEREGRPVRVGAVTEQPDDWLSAIANGYGIALAPESAARFHSRPGVVYRPVTGVSPTRVGVAWATADDRSPAVQDFVRCCLDLARRA